MAIELSEQRTSLAREVRRLEDLLEADANWRALRVLLSSAADGAASPSAGSSQANHHQERLRLERALKSNRVFCAREHLLEVIELMDAEAAGSSDAATAAAPDLFDETPLAASAVVPTKPPQPDILASGPTPAPDTFPGKSSAGDRDAFRTRVKVKIRTAPPDTDPSPLSSTPAAPPDDLTAIRGLDRETAERLIALGVTRWEQIAAWRTSDVRSVSAALGLDRKISRGNWIEQAALLSARAGRTVSFPRETAPKPTAEAEDKSPSGRLEHTSDPAGGTPATPPARIEGATPQAEQAEQATQAAQVEQAAKPSQTEAGALQSLALSGMIATAAASIAGRLGALQTTEATQASAVTSKATSREPLEAISEAIDDQATEAPDPQASEDPPRMAVGAETPSASVEAAQPVDALPAEPDSLTLIRTLTPEQESDLNELGVTRYQQIAEWDVDDVAHVSVVMGLGGRITRENWIEQAAVLARGGSTHYSSSHAQGRTAQLAPAPSPPLIADPLMQARLAELSVRLSTPAVQPESASPRAGQEPENGGKAHLPGGEPSRPDPEPAATVPGQATADRAPADHAPAVPASASAVSPMAATVVLSAGAAQALTAFASSQKLASQLRRDVLIEPESPPESLQEVSPESLPEVPAELAPHTALDRPAETGSAGEAPHASVAEDDIATEIVLPPRPAAGFTASQSDTTATADAEPDAPQSHFAAEPINEAAPVAVIEIPAQEPAQPTDTLEADVKIVPRGTPVSDADAPRETADLPTASIAARSPPLRSSAPPSDDFDDDDLPAWNGQIEEASVEIIPVAVRGPTPPREHDEPSQIAPDAADTGGMTTNDIGAEENGTKAVSRFLKALDGR